MNVADLARDEFARRLGTGGCAVRAGPFVLNVRTRLRRLADALHLLYADFPFDEDGIGDFHLTVDRSPGPHGLPRRTIECRFDGDPVFVPVSPGIALPLFEWGINWCIYTHAHHFLIVHAAVVERGGRALLLPGLPGIGKSTLCAALIHRGWRLLSDEFALLRLDDGRLLPMPRPVSLKNRAIDVIRDFAPEAVFGPAAPNTQKGTVAHLRPPAESVRRAGEPAIPAWIVFGAFEPGAATRLEPMPKARAFYWFADNAFNYHIFGSAGFEATGRLIDRSSCYRFTYSSLDDAVATFDNLAQAGDPAGGR